MVLGLLAASFAVPRSDAAFTDTTANLGNTVVAATVFPTVLYLHNNPSPPTGPTTTQGNLSFSRSVPTATTLFNYSSNYDAGPGRSLLQTNNQLAETNDRSVQRWEYPITADYSASSASSLTIWIAPQDFTPNKTVGLLVGLFDCDAGITSCWLLASSEVTTSMFPAAWTEVEIPFASVTHTFLTGRTFVLKIVPSPTTDIDVWVAYDTTSYPASFSFTL